MSVVSYDVRLVEEAVCRAASDLPREQQQLFRQERDRIYELLDGQDREAQFRRLHGEWFARLGLGRPIELALAAHPDIVAGIRLCQVIPAVSRKEESADLYIDSHRTWDDGPVPNEPRQAILVLRLRPESFLDPDRLGSLLHHELLHVADMLDPTFGYQKRLPCSDDGPAHDNILRERYRIVWDTSIDGRLVRGGLAPGGIRDARLTEFASAFPEWRPSLEEQFVRWFERSRPTHQEIVAFVSSAHPPARRGPNPSDGRCPICRFPAAGLDPHPERLSSAARRAIQARHPAWTIETGLCSQCADLYNLRG